MFRIGTVSALQQSSPQWAAFMRRMAELGYEEGKNFVFDFVPAANEEEYETGYRPLAAREPDIILATGPEIALKSALAATRTLPIVMIAIGTGVSLLTTTLAPKRLEILREVVPKASVIGVLLNPNSAGAQPQLEDVEKAARAIDQQMRILRASGERDFETAFAAMVQMRIGALIVGADPFFSSRRDQLVALAARDRIPAIYEWREFAEAVGLLSYGPHLAA